MVHFVASSSEKGREGCPEEAAENSETEEANCNAETKEILICPPSSTYCKDPRPLPLLRGVQILRVITVFYRATVETAKSTPNRTAHF